MLLQLYFIDCITIPQYCMNISLINQAPTCKYNAPKTVDFRVKYKTERCRYWEQQGYCPFGQMCAFAHHCLEIRNKGQIHEHYKTKPCLNFTKYGSCKYGDRCLFLHKLAQADRERTRSNSPVEQCSTPRLGGRHQQNLKILSQFGFSVFDALMKRTHSRITCSANYDECNQTTISTEPEAQSDYYEQMNDLQDIKVNDFQWSEVKKMRMYSM